MKLSKSLYSLIVWSLLQGPLAQAQSAYIESPLRPRIEEILLEHPDYRPERGIPVADGKRMNLPQFRNSLADGAPQFIAKLEKAYPGATFAFLGRDTQLISDIVDAFYLSIGQKGRVVQVGMSSPTLVNSTDAEILEYLKYFGFDITAVDKQAPFILVDTISKGEVQNETLISGRQGRKLLQTVYTHWVTNGADAKELLPKFNMIGMQVSTFDEENEDNKKRYKNIEKMSSVVESNAKKITKNNMDGEFGRSMVLPLIKDTSYIFNEAGYDHFTAAWHDKYQPPVRLEGGALAPNPGPLRHVNYRQSVLWIQHQVIDIVSDSTFRARVAEEFKAAKIKLPFNVNGVLISCRNVLKGQ